MKYCRFSGNLSPFRWYHLLSCVVLSILAFGFLSLHIKIWHCLGFPFLPQRMSWKWTMKMSHNCLFCTLLRIKHELGSWFYVSPQFADLELTRIQGKINFSFFSLVLLKRMETYHGCREVEGWTSKKLSARLNSFFKE